jgi:hypothetical protein
MDLIFLLSGVASSFLLDPNAWPLPVVAALAAGAAAGVRHGWWWCRSSPTCRACRTAWSSPASAASCSTTSAASLAEEAFDGWENSYHLEPPVVPGLPVDVHAGAGAAGAAAGDAPARRCAPGSPACAAGAAGAAGLPLLAWTLLLQVRFPDRGDFIHDWYRNAMYFTVFLYGYLLARETASGPRPCACAARAWACALACAAPISRWSRCCPTKSPGRAGLVWTLRNLYVWSMLLAILGWAHACSTGRSAGCRGRTKPCTRGTCCTRA